MVTLNSLLASLVGVHKIYIMSIHGRNYPTGIKKAHFVLVF